VHPLHHGSPSHQIPFAYNAPRYSASRAIDMPELRPRLRNGVTSDDASRKTGARTPEVFGTMKQPDGSSGNIKGPVAFRAFRASPRCARLLHASRRRSFVCTGCANGDVRLVGECTHASHILNLRLLSRCQIQPSELAALELRLHVSLS